MEKGESIYRFIQKGSKGSTNIQVAGDYYAGSTKEEAINISLDVFSNNF